MRRGRTAAVRDDGTLFERRDGEWADTGAPGDVADAAPVAGVLYAVTTDGTFLADAGDGWRERLLGVPGCRRIAVVPDAE
ncbi:HVO_0234 family beta-propeller protein [Halosegnis marinus]|uniref:HVO_0234 family beta-propeller protein n=1 Tax=Halosegnis marinus TaxID=3034023 RepID=UPI003617FE28